MGMRQKIGSIVLAYLRFWAKLKLKQNVDATVVGITGSAGKTSTRLAVASILATVGLVKHSAHANSESGISLNILGLTPRDYSTFDWLRMIWQAPWCLLKREGFDYYVAEMGIDSPTPPKNMEYLLSIVRPKIGVLLNAGLVHGANFDHLVPAGVRDREVAITRLIAAEKFKMLASLPPDGVAIWNCDQPELEELTHKLKCRQLTVGRSVRAMVRIMGTNVSASGFEMTIKYKGKEYALKIVDLLPDHYGLTLAMAIAVGVAVGVKIDDAVSALATYRAPAGRMRVFEGINNTHLLDSSYNASPGSMQDALVTLAKVAPKGKRVVVLGDMRELGEVTEVAHRELAKQVVKYADQVILFGPQLKKYTLPYLQEQKFPVEHFETIIELTKYLQREVKEKWILFKGSQNTILLERAVETMLANPEDKKLLCRRGEYWDGVRAKAV